MRLNLTEENKEDIILLYLMNNSMENISNIYNCSSWTIKNILNKNKVNIKRPGFFGHTFKIDENIRNEIVFQYKNGMCIKDLEKKYNLTHEYIWRLLKNNSIIFETKTKKGENNYNKIINDLVNLYINETKSIVDLSKIFNVSVGTIHRYLKKANIELRSIGYSKTPHNKISLKNLLDYDWMYNKIIIEKLTCNEIASLFNVADSMISKYAKLLKINIPHKWQSKTERKIIDWIKTIYDGEIISSYRKLKNKELDVYIPEFKLAIEYNGIYWHSEKYLGNKKAKYRHINKTELCDKNDVLLLQINSNEWENEIKRNIWKSIIKNKIGFTKNKYYARKLIIKEVLSIESKEFLEHNHLQGNVPASIRYGLYNNNELIMLATFGKSRFIKGKYELYRLSTKLETQVCGGASKLIKHFLKNYNDKPLISYCDRRYSNGKIYETLNFKKLRETTPNYKYVKKNKLYSRNQFQKHLLKDKLEIFNETLSESQNMINNGYYRIWDSGNFVYELSDLHSKRF